MSTKRCTYETCLDPEEIGCNRGFLLEDCEFWQKNRRDPGDQGNLQQRDGMLAEGVALERGGDSDIGDHVLRLPWTGNSLGVRDIELVTACVPTTVIGVIGPFNSGKTTLLTLIYLLTQRGEQLKTGAFAGSLSLMGWDNLAAYLRWQPGTAGPVFPPHTSRTAGRRPGLLHLAIRDRLRERRDFLFTDPPGEWFSQWARNANAVVAEGARWIDRHADRFLFLADCKALSSSERGKARDSLRDLARRVSSNLRERPIAVVWTKSDERVLSLIEDDLQECFATEFPQHAEFRIRMRFGNETRDEVEEPCLKLIDWVLAAQPRSNRGALTIRVRDESDLFLAYRGQV